MPRRNRNPQPSGPGHVKELEHQLHKEWRYRYPTNPRGHNSTATPEREGTTNV